MMSKGDNMEIFFTSDLHFGHDNIIRFDHRPFDSVEEMDQAIIERWNKKVTNNNDLVYILGDVSWYDDVKTASIVRQLRGKKVLILGNHDKRIKHQSSILFNEIVPYKEIFLNNSAKVVMCHYPIPFYNGHYHKGIMLYGHVHVTPEEKMTQDYAKELRNKGIPCEMHNVGCMLWNYEPVTLQEIEGKKRKIEG